MGTRTLERLPGWVKRMDEVAGKFSNPGFHGLVDFHAQANALGECMTSGVIPPRVVQAWINEQVAKYSAEAGMKAPILSLYTNPKVFWEKMWSEILKEKVTLPIFPRLKTKTREAMERFELIPMYLCGLNERAIGSSFFSPITKRYRELAEIAEEGLPGCWILVETIFARHHSQKFENAHGTDPLARELDLPTRFNVLWSDLEDNKFPWLAKQMGLPKMAIRFPTASEWNLIENLFGYLCYTFGKEFPSIELGHEITSTYALKYKTRISIGSHDLARSYGLGCEKSQAVGQVVGRSGSDPYIGWRIVVTLASPTQK